MVVHFQSKQKAKKRPAKPKASAKSADVGNLNLVLNIRKRLQLTQTAFARLLALSVRSLASLENGARPTDPVARRLNELSRLTDALDEVLTNDGLGTWLQTPNAAFSGLKPVEVIERGESDRIWAMIYFLRSGVPA